jgi:cytochrome oxidase Cu insertion factor (SCO1/SenC/PrrC family)
MKQNPINSSRAVALRLRNGISGVQTLEIGIDKQRRNDAVNPHLVSPWSRRGIKQRLQNYALLGLGTLAVVLCCLAAVGYATTTDYLPDIKLINQNSSELSLASLRGKPVLVGFVHTMCKGVCQMMTAKMRSVVSALPSAPSSDVTMLLITTDPSDDRPRQLQQYAKSQDLPGKGWVLVTGSEENIKRVMRIYGVSHQDSDDAMMHVMKLFLIAPDGSIAHVYPGMNASPQTVASDIRVLSRYRSAPPESSATVH